MGVNYSIRAVAERTGLSAHTIRAWERRYGVLSPARTGSNRRMYDEEAVDRLVCLRDAVAAGHSIGMIAGMATEDLKALTERSPDRRHVASAGDFLSDCIRAMRELDVEMLEGSLIRATAVMGVDQFLTDLVLPLLANLNQGWEDGTIGIAQEHLATAVLRTQLDRIRVSLQAPPDAPRLLVTTPQGQTHEIGALLVAITAAREGWHVTYLGPNLPASEITSACNITGANAVALSLVYPEGEPQVESELRNLRQSLGRGFPIIVGGRARDSYLDVLRDIDAITEAGFETIRETLGHVGRKPTSNLG